MLNIWFAIFSSLGFIILLNNNIIFMMKDSIQQSVNNTLLENPAIINNKFVWNSYKIYATSKNTLVTFYNNWQRNMYKKNLRSNILLITNGKRTQTILCKDNLTSLTCNDVLKYKDNKADLILFRTPSKDKNVDYDLVRLDNLNNITFNENTEKITASRPASATDSTPDAESTLDADSTPDAESSTSENIEDVENTINSCNASMIELKYDNSPHKIYTPALTVKNTDLTYDLSLEKDNYNITGNKLFDKAFVEWILNEKYGATLDKDYHITYFDDEMNEKVIERKDAITLDNDKITLVCGPTENKPESSSWIW